MRSGSLSERAPARVVAPALLAASAFAAGIALCSAEKPSVELVPFFALAAAFSAVLGFGARGAWRGVAFIAAFFAAGAARYAAFTAKTKDHWTNLQNILAVRGIVCDYPYFSGTTWSATLRITAADTGDGFKRCSGKIKLYIKDPEVPLSYGQLWELVGRPRKLAETPNFFAIRYAALLRSNGIDGVFHARRRDARLLDDDRGSPILRSIVAPVRRHITSTVREALPGTKGALLEGMLLGGGRRLPQEVRKMFSDTGNIHILAVSGLHIGIVALVFWWLLRRILRLGHVTTAVAVLVVLLLYAAVVQFRPAALRATIMAAFVMLAPLVGRRGNSINALGAAALALLAIKPTDLFNPGFELSFAATGGILYFLPRIAALVREDLLLRRDIAAKALGLFLVTITVQLGVAPISALHFHKFQLIAPITNVLVVPAVTPAISLGFAGVAAAAVWQPLGRAILALDGFVLDYILFVVRLFSSLPFAFVPLAHPSAAAVLGYYALVIGAAEAPWRRWGRFTALFGLAALAAAILPKIASGRPEAEVVFFKLNGTAVYARTRGADVLFLDCEPRDVEVAIVPFLYAVGRRRVDVLCLPLTRNTLSTAASLARLVEHESALVPPQFPDSARPEAAVNCSLSCADIGARFVSAKNCGLSLGGVSLLLALAPPKGVPEDAWIMLDFPAELSDDTTFVARARAVVLGSRALGWRKICKEAGVKTLDASRKALWLRFRKGSVDVTTCGAAQ